MNRAAFVKADASALNLAEWIRRGYDFVSGQLLIGYSRQRGRSATLTPPQRQKNLQGRPHNSSEPAEAFLRL